MGIVAAVSLLFVPGPLSGNRAVPYGGLSVLFISLEIRPEGIHSQRLIFGCELR